MVNLNAKKLMYNSLSLSVSLSIYRSLVVSLPGSVYSHCRSWNLSLWSVSLVVLTRRTHYGMSLNCLHQPLDALIDAFSV